VTSLKNVQTLKANGGSVGELAIDLRKWAESGEAVDAIVLTRGPDGALGIQYTTQETAQIGELSHFLAAHVQHQLWSHNEPPEMIDEDEGCDED